MAVTDREEVFPLGEDEQQQYDGAIGDINDGVVVADETAMDDVDVDGEPIAEGQAVGGTSLHDTLRALTKIRLLREEREAREATDRANRAARRAGGLGCRGLAN